MFVTCVSQLARGFFRLKYISENCDFGQTLLVIFTILSSPLDNSCLPYDLLVKGLINSCFVKSRKSLVLFHFSFQL